MPADPINPQDLTGLDEDKLFAILSYVGVLVLVPLLLNKNDPFVNFHAKQGLVILAGLILALIAAAWVPPLGTVLFLVLLVLDLIALVQALLGRRWKIPVIGHLAAKFTV